MRAVSHDSTEVPETRFSDIMKRCLYVLLETNFSADYRAKWGGDPVTIEQMTLLYEASIAVGG